MGKTNSEIKERYIKELEENFWEGWSNFGRGEGSELFLDDKTLWYRTPLTTIPYTAVLKFQHEKNIDNSIDEIIEKCREGGRDFVWLVTPSSEPKDLGERLTARGMTKIETMPGMTRSLNELPAIPTTPTGIEIREVVDNNDQQGFLEFVTWRWSIPADFTEAYQKVIEPFKVGQVDSNVRILQAWKDGVVVSKVLSYQTDTSLGIYGVATRPEARRMGLARLLTLMALHKGREGGLELGVLHSTPMAEPLYASMGFEKQTEFYLYASIDMHI
jgi:GNAT superfamily N-acetyltransferase